MQFTFFALLNVIFYYYLLLLLLLEEKEKGEHEPTKGRNVTVTYRLDSISLAYLVLFTFFLLLYTTVHCLFFLEEKYGQSFFSLFFTKAQPAHFNYN